ncbi:MAG: PIN domain nuclease [Peptococcaceae bacterium]|jgi:uncharacterized protein YacL|nr:PIN domain nuclease [Peptococcaceae bacterium]
MDNSLNKTDRMIRIIVTAIFGVIGFTTALLIVLSGFYRITFMDRGIWLGITTLAAFTCLSLALGFFLTPFLVRQTKWLIRWWESKLIKIPAADLLGAVFGLIIGLIIAYLAGPNISGIPIMGRFLPLALSVLLGYLGFSLGMKKWNEIFNSIRIRNLAVRDRKKGLQPDSGAMSVIADVSAEGALIREGAGMIISPKILDTSVIIDGRISDIYKTGFLSGTIVVPRFVLTELQHIADSSDVLKRNRGRRGLDILNTMRKEMLGDMQVVESDFTDVSEVDAKLVLLARQMDGEILTIDYNLNKVAEFQDIRVLNINDLVNALKQVYLPGEEMVVHVIKEGKEQRQGIGYLDDGTMIVVDTGKKYINQTIHTVVTSVLQTSAGRMIFVKPKFTDKRVFAEVEA